MNKLPKRITKQMKKYPKFYKRVWTACFNIHVGKTLTYKQIAEKIGMPKAARAVGTALAKNPFAPIIPCHRIIRSDGKLGGYSALGGLHKKQQMIEYEKKTRKNASLD